VNVEGAIIQGALLLDRISTVKPSVRVREVKRKSHLANSIATRKRHHTIVKPSRKSIYGFTKGGIS